MRRLLRHLSTSSSRPASGWLTLFLLLAVLAPSACLIWFMNQAMRNERQAVREQLMDNLSQARARLDAHWREIGHEIDTNLPPPAQFAAIIRAGMADSAICFDARGSVAYPDAGLPRDSETQVLPAGPKEPSEAAGFFADLAQRATNDMTAATALEAQARNLIEAGKVDEALAVVTNELDAPRFARMTDAQGRLIVSSAELLVLEAAKRKEDLAKSVSSETSAKLEPLSCRPLLLKWRGELTDYQIPMPAPQRRFLMRQGEKLFPMETPFSTRVAEDLAAVYVTAGPMRVQDSSLRPAPLPGVWQMAFSDGRVLLLFKKETLQAMFATVLGTNVVVVPPNGQVGEFAVSAGESQPGWQISPSRQQQGLLNTIAEAQIASYLWVGILTLVAVVALAWVSLRMIRRQAAVARLRNDLVANVTHELKTPLASMRLLVDTLLNAPVLNEETARQYLQLIAQENLRLSRLIDNFLAFSRMERNKQAFDFGAAAPRDIVEAAAAVVRERFSAPECHFEAQAAADLPRVSADTGAMVTALVNLLDNAYKYSGEQKEIFLQAGKENGHVTFAVRDNGIGVPPGETKRIFRRFYQVDQGMARERGGCGLGLSIVEFIVTAHHGTVRVESEPGHGSTFIISLPLAHPTGANGNPS